MMGVAMPNNAVITPQGTTPYAVYYIPMSHLKSEEIVPQIPGLKMPTQDKSAAPSIAPPKEAYDYNLSRLNNNWADTQLPISSINAGNYSAYGPGSRGGLPPLKKNFVPKSRKVDASNTSIFNHYGDSSLSQKADSTFRQGMVNTSGMNNILGNTGNSSISRFDSKLTKVKVQVAAGVETELELPEQTYMLGIIDEIFKHNPQEFSSEKVDDYCICINGKSLSSAQKVCELDLTPTTKLTLEKKQNSE